MAELGKAYIQVVPSAKGITGKLKSVLGKETQVAGDSAGSAFSKKFGATVVKGIAALGLGKAISDSIGLGAELEQNIGGTEAVFAKYAKDVRKTAKGVWKTQNISASDYMATINKLGALYQANGFTAKESFDVASKAMERAADMASVMGTDTQTAYEAIVAAARGEFEQMENLGIKMSATSIEAYEKAHGNKDFKWADATELEKQEAMLKMFFDNSEKYAGNAAKESQHTISGSVNALKSAWENLLGSMALGEDVYPQIEAVGEALVAAGKNVLPAIGNVILSIPKVIWEHREDIKTALTDMLSSVDVNEVANGIQTAIGGAFEKLEANLPTIAEDAFWSMYESLNRIIDGEDDLMPKVEKAVDDLSIKIAEKMPGIVKTIGTKVIPALLVLFGQITVIVLKAIPTLVKSALQLTLVTAGAITDGLLQILGTIFTAVKTAVGNAVGGVIDSIVSTIAGLADKVKGAAMGVVKVFTGAWSDVKSKTSEAFAKIKSAMSKPLDTAKAVVKASLDKITSVFGGLKKIPSNVRATFNNVKNAALKPLYSLRDKVKGIISKIKSYFPFNIGKVFSGFKTPSIDLITATKTLLGKTFTYPKGFKVAWHAKAMDEPYMFNNATLFGAGEAGDEMLYGRKNLLKDIREATGGGGAVVNNYITVNGADDPEEWGTLFAHSMMKELRMA